MPHSLHSSEKIELDTQITLQSLIMPRLCLTCFPYYDQFLCWSRAQGGLNERQEAYDITILAELHEAEIFLAKLAHLAEVSVQLDVTDLIYDWRRKGFKAWVD
jgi:hypothetical protein